MAASCGFIRYFLVVLLVVCAIPKIHCYNSYGYELMRGVDIDCVQCNMRQLGIMNTCESPAQRHNCTGCMKTKTRIRIKDSGTMTGFYRYSEVISRYCMRIGATNAKREGCYRHQNNGGFTEQCYCYTHNCNSHATSLKQQLGTPAVLLCLLMTIATRISQLL